uniref:Uncharacterized protein n=1 Tax=Geospiza parvula TaxID=87175 RepID=A0A8C3MHP1_GEOPR
MNLLQSLKSLIPINKLNSLIFNSHSGCTERVLWQMLKSFQATKLAGSLGVCADVSRIQIISFSAIMTIGGRRFPFTLSTENSIMQGSYCPYSRAGN